MKKMEKCVSGPVFPRAVAAAAIIVLLLVSGCATKIKVNMLQPAKYHQASLTRTVAVLPFEGKDGAAFASELESVLASVMIGGKPYFTLVDRMSINKTLSELQLSQSGLLDEKTASTVGRMLGAQGIYTGTVTANDASDTVTTQTRTECAQYKILKDKDGKPYQGPCVRYVHRYVRCTDRVASFSVAPKLVDVSTGQILYAENLSDTARSYGCDDTGLVEAKEVLLKRVKDNVKKRFRTDIAPFYTTEEIALMNSKDMIPTKEAVEKLKQGIAFAGKDRMDRACELWEDARTEAPDSPAILFNLGVCAESRGDFGTALTFYHQADRLMMKPDDNITSALKRTQKAIDNQKLLGEQLKRVKP
ncbi:MAG TPA: CsgG/HfaB family protein [Syntrophales bacterium]|nr:CsgG/HfaB family protein [Syntrophales bacterium]HQB31649.1 CsgG/HfaB family protein [Syntrophales bacterium]